MAVAHGRPLRTRTIGINEVMSGEALVTALWITPGTRPRKGEGAKEGRARTPRGCVSWRQ